MVVIGDVCGKGVDAAVVTALTRYTVPCRFSEHDDPSRVLEIINEVLLHHDNNRHCSAAVARLRRVEQGWTVADLARRSSAGVDSQQARWSR